ncbi:hypothetical protein HMPREF1585_01024 [Gardnerella vaginalis JCP8481B]|nr:hypothetical protein HMPREF1585_01024 [Gardnerella vaginalis JCP8481B]
MITCCLENTSISATARYTPRIIPQPPNYPQLNCDTLVYEYSCGEI